MQKAGAFTQVWSVTQVACIDRSGTVERSCGGWSNSRRDVQWSLDARARKELLLCCFPPSRRMSSRRSDSKQARGYRSSALRLDLRGSTVSRQGNPRILLSEGSEFLAFGCLAAGDPPNLRKCNTRTIACANSRATCGDQRSRGAFRDGASGLKAANAADGDLLLARNSCQAWEDI